MTTAQLIMVEGERKGRSGSYNYLDTNVQAVHERLGIPYEATNHYSLAMALSHSKYGIQVVEFINGAICYGAVNSSEHIPAPQTLRAIERMSGVKSALYIRKEAK